MIMYDIENNEQNLDKKPKVMIIGVGGAGGNILNAIIKENLPCVSFLALNTDFQALENVCCSKKIILGKELTSGMGTGSNPEVGKIALEENIDEIINILDGVDIAFLVGGMGGGTGSGALPLLAKILHEKMILSIALVTKPFFFEGSRRSQVAQNGILKLEEYVDTMVTIPNQKLFEDPDMQEISLTNAFEKINMVIVNSIKAVTETIFSPGNINVDFADIKTIMSRMGRAVIGIGSAEGEDRAVSAIQKAISSPLLENNSLKGARSILLNISGDSSVSLYEMNIIASYVHDEVHPEAHIILGSTINTKENNDSISVTIIATGFEDIVKNRITNKNILQNQTIQNSQFGYSTNYNYQNNQNMYTNTHTQTNQNKQLHTNHNTANRTNKNDIQKDENITMKNNLDIPTFIRNQN